jgi:hypothetical protein
MSHIFTPSGTEMAAMAATASAAGYGHLTILLEAVNAGLIGLLVPTRPAILPKRQLRRCDIPTIVLVGDDDHETTGPSAWAWASSLQRWATRAIVHGAGATLTEYRAAVYMCLAVNKLVLVETSSSHIPTWATHFAEAKPPVPIALIVPRDGQHPKPIPREQMQ